MHQPLDNLRVIDLTSYNAGPYCTTMLGDMGADVIKVERPKVGDPIRQMGPLITSDSCSLFLGLNRNKQSLTLDVQDPRGYEILLKLLKEADVFIHSLRPSTAEKMGLDYETLANQNSKLIYCAISAYGETGPLREKGGMDLIIQALGGTLALTGEPGQPPVKIGPAVADFAGSFLAFAGILLAYIVRLRWGFGQKVSINLLDGQLVMLTNYVPGYFTRGDYTKPFGKGHPDIMPYQSFKAADMYFAMACLTDKFWQSLCKAIGKDDLAEDDRFKTNRLRVQHREILEAELEAVFVEKPASYWIDRLTEYDVPCAPVHTFKTLFDDPQVLANEMLVELPHPEAKTVKMMGIPIRLSKTAGRLGRAAPKLGADTDQVLQQVGLTAEEIAQLRRGGVV